MFKLLAAEPAACIAKEFGGVDGIEGGSVSQHQDTFTATHIVKVGIGADIDEEFFRAFSQLCEGPDQRPLYRPILVPR